MRQATLNKMTEKELEQAFIKTHKELIAEVEERCNKPLVHMTVKQQHQWIDMTFKKEDRIVAKQHKLGMALKHRFGITFRGFRY